MREISGLHHIAILCSQEDRSRSFYEHLGFRLTRRRVREERGDVILLMEGYGIALELFADPRHPARVTDPEALGLRHLALHVEKGTLESVIKALRKQGILPEPVRHDSCTGEAMTFVKDPDGLPIELHE